jgi:TolA-binding protein
LRRLYQGLADLLSAGGPATLDHLRPTLDNIRLFEKALQLQEVGRNNPNRATLLRQVLDQFRDRRERIVKQQLHNQLQAANEVRDHQAALELLRRLQNRSIEQVSDTSTQGDWEGSAPSSIPPDAGVRS